MRYRRAARDVACEIQAKFGYVALGTDDNLHIGEFLPNMVSQGQADDGVTATVTAVTTYKDYAKQAKWAGFGDTCADCFDYYFKVEVKVHETKAN